MKKIFACLSLVFLTGCANPYAQFYTNTVGGVLPPNLQPSIGEPEIIRGSDRASDDIRMLEDGYVAIGYSSFTAGEATEKQAAAQAKKVDASKIILYSVYQSTQSGVTPLTLPTTNNSTTNYSGNVYGGSGGYSSYSGAGTTTTYGQQTTYIPYSVDRYEYFASYWVKATKFRLGAYVEELTSEDRARLQSNMGVKVVAVAKKSPAFYAEIFRGDIIKKFGDMDLADDEDYMSALNRYEGKDAKLTIYRNGKSIEKALRVLD